MLTSEVIILADGQFPEHKIPLNLLHSGRSIVCCDGAAMKAVAAGLEPAAIVGDLDSLTAECQLCFADRLVFNPDQETNDLTKAVSYCIKQGVKKVIILGATGNREDHTLGNLSLLTDYALQIETELYSDTGWFVPVLKSSRLESAKGQQVSIFSLTPTENITLRNLKYPVENKPLSLWWQGTLNEALGDWFELIFDEGKYLIFRLYTE